jgi:hypothetical protein
LYVTYSPLKLDLKFSIKQARYCQNSRCYCKAIC